MIASTDMDGLGGNLWMQVFVYSIGFFFDFWAYTLMTIGIGKIFGYDLSINFFHPYYSASFREFWHRWNITLGTWLRDYVYIPLGGNRLSSIKQSGTVLLVFIISGMWHGTTFPFLVWGVCHAGLLVLERKFMAPKRQFSLMNVCYAVVVFIMISLLWQLFIVNSIEDAIQRYNALFKYQPIQRSVVLKLILCAAAYAIFTSNRVFSLIQRISENRIVIIFEVSMLTIMMAILILLNCPMSFNFFYFRF